MARSGKCRSREDRREQEREVHDNAVLLCCLTKDLGELYYERMAVVSRLLHHLVLFNNER
jgi:hypothetical protein